MGPTSPSLSPLPPSPLRALRGCSLHLHHAPFGDIVTMPPPAAKLTSAVQAYLKDLRTIRASGGATGELSYYPPLSNLLNTVGATLRPKVTCVTQLADHGAGHPDLGLYTARQLRRGKSPKGQLPERGVIEVKPAGDDAWLTADSDQVSKYWGTYRLVLVTNTRDFVLLGEDAHGNPAKLETFRTAESAQDFETRLETPQAFANDVGRALGEYLCRALSHTAALVEPRDLAWLLASYARDGQVALLPRARHPRPPPQTRRSPPLHKHRPPHHRHPPAYRCKCVGLPLGHIVGAGLKPALPRAKRLSPTVVPAKAETQGRAGAGASSPSPHRGRELARLPTLELGDQPESSADDQGDQRDGEPVHELRRPDWLESLDHPASGEKRTEEVSAQNKPC